MLVFKQIKKLRQHLDADDQRFLSIGFVPTMGALHEGHLQLMRKAKNENDLLIVSIFVNPIQFNNPEDLQKYPRTYDEDAQMLESVGCDVLFYPSVDEMYPEPEIIHYDFGLLAETMEGSARPGHFDGVAIVVRKLFDIVKPHRAYFGEKDFQQLAIIKELVRRNRIPVNIIPCPIVRERDGLAMSSRNARLTAKERAVAPKIYETLQDAVGLFPTNSPAQMKAWVRDRFQRVPAFQIDYVEIADDKMLQPLQGWSSAKGAILFVAIYLGQVRLIDNIRIY